MLIKIEKFQGPLNLLLKLIQQEKLDITEINLAKIADQYVNYIKNSSKINPEEMVDFLVVAAKLLFIKSKALLPYLHTPEDEEEIYELEQQLKMYKEFLQAVEKIKKIIKKQRFFFAREFDKKVIIQGINIFTPPKKITAITLHAIFKEFIKKNQPREQKLAEEKLEYKINIEDKILFIQQNLLNKVQITFSQILKQAKSKTEIIVSFLAILELIKQQIVFVRQTSVFGEILIMNNE